MSAASGKIRYVSVNSAPGCVAACKSLIISEIVARRNKRRPRHPTRPTLDRPAEYIVCDEAQPQANHPYDVLSFSHMILRMYICT